MSLSDARLKEAETGPDGVRTLSKRDIAFNRSRLFAWGQGIEVPTPFANRVGAVNQLSKAIERAKTDKAGRLICISDSMGSGKTFLLKHVLNTLEAGHIHVHNMLKEADLLEELRKANLAPYEHLSVVDDWDIKSSLSKWLEALGAVAEHVRTTGGTIMLIGDGTLNSPYVREYLGGLGPTKFVKLEPLTKTLFYEALGTRLADCFGSNKTAPFIDPDLVEFLIPPWAAGSATFRAVFRTLDDLSDRMIPSEEKCLVGKDQVGAWLDARRTSAKRNIIECAERIVEYTKDNLGQVKPISDDELVSLLDYDGDVHQFRKNIVKSLIGMEALAAVGDPILVPDTEYIKYNGPYVPAVRTNLRVYFER